MFTQLFWGEMVDGYGFRQYLWDNQLGYTVSLSDVERPCAVVAEYDLHLPAVVGVDYAAEDSDPFGCQAATGRNLFVVSRWNYDRQLKPRTYCKLTVCPYRSTGLGFLNPRPQGHSAFLPEK